MAYFHVSWFLVLGIMFWIVVAILTAVVALVLISPLLRKSENTRPDQPNEVAVYQDQLRELERERESGVIGAAEADYARAEIGRRLIASADKAAEEPQVTSAGRANRIVANAILCTVPLLGLCLYLWFGSPEQPDMPLEARLENPGDNMDLILAKIERHLAQNPEDAKGWDVVAPVYFALGRLDDAQNAFRNAIRIDGETPARLTGLGEALVNSNDGIVIEEAKNLFQRVLALEPNNPRGQFYSGLAAQQSGDLVKARSIYQQLVNTSEPDASWLPLVRQHLAQVDGSAKVPTATISGPTADDIEAASQMNAQDRQAMIQSMVTSLETKLEADPNNLEGWQQLLRSYSVLGDKDKANAAYAKAKKAFAVDSDEAKQIHEMARALGISEAGGTQ